MKELIATIKRIERLGNAVPVPVLQTIETLTRIGQSATTLTERFEAQFTKKELYGIGD
jgi:hypothetical protein